MHNNPCPETFLTATSQLLPGSHATILIEDKIYCKEMPVWQSLPPLCLSANTSSSLANQGQCVYLRPKSASIGVCQSLSRNKARGMRRGL